MKYTITILFICLTFLSFAQPPTGDIQKDTAQANRYFEEATSNGLNNKIEVSIDLLEKAVALYKNYPFNDQQLLIEGQLARLLVSLGRYVEAEKLAFSTLKIGEQAYPNATIIPALSTTYLALFEALEDPIEVAKYGFKRRDCSKDDLPDYFHVTTILIYELYARQAYHVADSLLTELEEIAALQDEKTSNQYSVYINRSKMFRFSLYKQFEQAIIYGEQFFRDNEKYKIYPLEELASSYIKMGEFYTEASKYDEAIDWTLKGMKLVDVPKDHPKYGFYYTSLAYIYTRKLDYPTAIEHYEKGIKLLLKDTIASGQVLAMAYYDLSNIYLGLEDFKNAEKHIKLSQRFHPNSSVDFQLGHILFLQGKVEAAIVPIHRAIISICTYFKDKDVTKNPSASEVYLNDRAASIFLYSKGYYLFDLGKKRKDISMLESAIETANLSLALIEKSWQNTQGFDRSRFVLNERMVGSLTVIVQAQEAIYQLTPSEENFNNHFKTTERIKALQLIETLSGSLLPEALYMEEQENIQAVQNAEFNLEIMKMQNNKDSITYYKNDLFKASQSLENYKKRIQKDYPKVSENFHNTTYTNVEEVQKVIGKEGLFISYNVGLKIGSITTISHNDKKIVGLDSVNFISNIKKINELIQDRFAFQKSAREEFIEVSHQLYNTLIKPIESELEGKTQLMIIVEGQLFHLPFELLLKNNEKKPYHELDFLIKKYAVNYHYSATAFLKLQEKQTVKDNSLLAFAPIFSKGNELNEATRSLDFMVDSLYRSIDNFEFSALPSTKKEVKAIAKLVKANDGKANVLLAKNATKAKLATELESQSYQFIHIATHGLVNFKNPKLSALACYSKNEKMDNLMYANEIQFKNINADLVVLSSCESGIGQLIEGEGLIALNRSFIYSGAKNVLFSLWKVSDKYSSDLMIDFYKNYFKNPSYTSALRQAKLKMLSNPTSAQPKYWSAFVLMGE